MALAISEENFIGNALNRARGQYDNAIDTAKRNAERMGINPNSARYQGLEQSAQYGKAAGMASAANVAGYNWLKNAQASSDTDDQMQYRYAALNNQSNMQNRELNFNRWKLEQDLKFKKGYGKELDNSLGQNNANNRQNTANTNGENYMENGRIYSDLNNGYSQSTLKRWKNVFSPYKMIDNGDGTYTKENI